MRILHLVTLVSPEGAFGGPVRVASNLAAEQRARGHEVMIAAGTTGYDVPPTRLDGTALHSEPLRRVAPGGFSGLASTRLSRWVDRAVRGADVVHAHLARDLVTLPGARSAARHGTPYVVQPHGMVMPSDSPLAPVLDTALTRSVLRSAGAVLHLTPVERAGLLEVAGTDLPFVELPNGVPTAPVAPLPPQVEVLYCARLHARKRPLFFVETATRLLGEGVDARFTLVGPDEGEGPAVQAAIDAFGDPRITWEGPLEPALTLARMARASLFVLPSVDEPYPMAVLEALSVGRGVVITDTCGLAPIIGASGAGVVADASSESLTAAVRGLLASDLAAVGAIARATAEEQFSMTAVGDRLEAVYASIRA